ncbi:MAG TPA: DNA alkylation repair protein, partial [Planctomycetia bacterium]|nr:DNA alkylation repair protein [Planctomycetia bacterium]
LAEDAADDERNFVKKAVSWALRAVGSRNPALRAEALEIAERLAASKNATERWTGKDVLRDLSRAPAKKRAERGRSAATKAPGKKKPAGKSGPKKAK